MLERGGGGNDGGISKIGLYRYKISLFVGLINKISKIYRCVEFLLKDKMIKPKTYLNSLSCS